MKCITTKTLVSQEEFVTTFRQKYINQSLFIHMQWNTSSIQTIEMDLNGAEVTVEGQLIVKPMEPYL